MFRPTTLDDVVRQEHIVTILKNQIETGRVGHAYLFCGPRGTGKTSIAKIFAASINCEKPVNGSPCGKCEACKALADPSNLDISEIDAASNNGVDEMRDLREKVQYPPVGGKYKVYIIDEAHMLSQNAFNALLKTLEEPPSHAVFILATTESQKIPATILSRCMRFDFKLIPQADLEGRLKKVFDSIGKKYEEKAISAIARAGAGSVRDMLSIADTCVSYSTDIVTYEAVSAVLGKADFSTVSALCEAMLQGNAGDALEKTEQILSTGKNVGSLLVDIMSFLNDCAVVKMCRDAQNILAMPDETYAETLRIARETDGHRLLRTTEIFVTLESDLRYSSSPRVLLESAVLKASMPEVDYDIEALLSRIEGLERKIANGVTVTQTEPVAPAPVAVVTAKPIQEEPIEETPFDDEPYYDPPLVEEPPVDFTELGSTPVSPKKREEKPEPKTTEVKAPPMKQAVSGDSKSTFGNFLRSLRKTGKNGVLFTICMDLDHLYEEDKFVLITSSESIYRSLTKPEHYALIKQAFDLIGIAEDGFEVRLRGKKSDDFNKNLEELKNRFPDTKIDVK
jgi:DNA polymerase-3 subunit gamma/tau